MSPVGMVLFGIGAVIMVVAGLVLLVKAFQTSVLWGLGYIFVPFVSLIFVILYWQDTKKWFFYSLLGTAIFVVGVVVGGPPTTEMSVN